MKNILVFCFFPAFNPPKSGGEVRLFHFYNELSRYYNITLLTSTYYDIPEETVLHNFTFKERRIPKDNFFMNAWGKLSPFAGNGDLSALSVLEAGNYPTLMHQAYLEEYPKADIIIHDSPFTIGYDLFASIDSKVRVYNSYNCEYTLYQKLHLESKSQPLHKMVYDAEVKMLRTVDLVGYCGQDDLTEFQEMVADKLKNHIYVPNGLSPQKLVISNDKKKKIQNAVFIGSGHLPNVAAANAIVYEIAPKLPYITFHIIGSCISEGEYPSNVVRYGLVDNSTKQNIFMLADIALNPTTSGSGSNLKILDFFASGIPVLTTPFGARGFELEDKNHCLIASLDNFVDVLSQWQNKAEDLKTIGFNGHKHAIANYSWRTIAKNFHVRLEETCARKNITFKDFILALNDYDPIGNNGGGGTRITGIYTAISKWRPVVLLCLSDQDKIEVEKLTDSWAIIRIPKTQLHREAEQFHNSQFWISVSDIVAMRHVTHNPWIMGIYSILRIKASHIISDHPYMISIPKYFGDRFVYSSQNNETLLKTKLLEWHPDKEALIRDVAKMEEFAVSMASLVVAVSDEDAETLLVNRQISAPIVTIRNGAMRPIEPSLEDKQIVKEKIKEHSVVFLGSGHIPNVEAAKYIIESLATKMPEVEFHLLGSVCNSLPENLPKNVVSWGIVGDSLKTAIMQECRFAINPMFSGSGSNVKLADFIGNGLFVVTTEFGKRGYPEIINQEIVIADSDSFANEINKVMDQDTLHNDLSRERRREIFNNHLSMEGLGGALVDLLQNLERPKKKVLFVTYRYTYPILGGAEDMLSHLISVLGDDEDFCVDIVATDTVKIEEKYRFTSVYTTEKNIGAMNGHKSIRFARFPVTSSNPKYSLEQARKIWQVQPIFEYEVYIQLKSFIQKNGLAWGWDNPSLGGDDKWTRWTFNSFGIHLTRATSIQIKAHVTQEGSILIRDESGHTLIHSELTEWMDITFDAMAGTVECFVSAPCSYPDDARPLGIFVYELNFDTVTFDLTEPTVSDIKLVSQLEAFHIYGEAEKRSRSLFNLALTEARGPYSNELEEFLSSHISEYDLVITHNNVFRPPIFAIQQAKKHGIPSILIPHAHLDDDFYHFQDVLDSALNATMVLAAPKVACEYYTDRGVKHVEYLPAGIDSTEVFSQEDIDEFNKVRTGNKPFILVLGRKAKAKNYQSIIDAVEYLSSSIDLDVIIIGPDDDGVRIESTCAYYLGRQSRSVVRGALQSCVMLVNMSTSESFGIVLLEAWMAKKPVIANEKCAAFHDLIEHEVNGLFANENNLYELIEKLFHDFSAQKIYGQAGYAIVQQYDWNIVNTKFIELCKKTIKNSLSDKNLLIELRSDDKNEDLFQKNVMIVPDSLSVEDVNISLLHIKSQKKRRQQKKRN